MMLLPLLQIKNLSIDFVTAGEKTTAIENVSLEINRGEIVGLVGESGSGKSITALSILQLLPTPPAHYSSGKILFTANEDAAIDLLNQSAYQMRLIRGNQVAMIFQEPMTSLNPL